MYSKNNLKVSAHKFEIKNVLKFIGNNSKHIVLNVSFALVVQLSIDY